EMPSRPEIIGAGMPNEKAHTYRLGGTTCLAGDVIGDYSFDRPLEIGDRLVFTDMAHYTMVKTTTFNGIRLPAICRVDETSREVRTVKTFGYVDYMQRLS
ncbi:MAG: carboxynorspermidine decarboxylase, partial [Halomonas sp.]|nr:carboxynorspermidine decarboxylase [Halomonas sp.]